ncbi:MAG: hypothetical protein HYU78_13965 [Rhodocyclales bacterium]|nr:hypothetical protein [Rhodocyclales bacterium]
MKVDKGLMTVARLIAIKKEELEQHRLDLRRLQQLLQSAEASLKQAEENERSFVDEMRDAQSGSRKLDAAAMIESRRYLGVLQGLAAERRGMFDDIDKQCSLAQSELEQVFAEVRALERLAERRRTRVSLDEKRVGYLHADDQELTRVANKRSDHAVH